MTSMALAATLFGPEDLRMVELPLDPGQHVLDVSAPGKERG